MNKSEFIPLSQHLNVLLSGIDPETLAMDDFLFDLAMELSCVRIGSGMTKKEVARACGTSIATITKIESGHHNTSAIALYKYAKAVGAKVEINIYR